MVSSLKLGMIAATILSAFGIALIALAASLNSLYISIAGAASIVLGAAQYAQAMKHKREPSPVL